MSSRQRVVGQPLVADLLHCVKEAGKVGSGAVIEAEGEFVGVAEEVMRQSAGIGAVHHSVHLTLEVLDAVGMNLALNVADRVINESVSETFAGQSPIRLVGVGEDFGSLLHVGLDLVEKGLLFSFLNAHNPNLADSPFDAALFVGFLTTLQEAEHNSLAVRSASLDLLLLLVQVHGLCLLSNIGLIAFYNAGHFVH